MVATGLKTTDMKLKEVEFGRRIEDLLRADMEAGYTDQEIADHLGVPIRTFYRWKQRLGADVRTTRQVEFATERKAAEAL